MFGSLFGGDSRSAEPAEDATSQPSSGAGNFFSGLTDIGRKLQKGVENIADQAFSDFNKEQEAFVRGKHKGTEAAVPPWVGASNEEELKAHILKLSTDERNFLRDPPPGARTFTFNFDTAFPVALSILPHDDLLKERRFELVPKKLSEEHFWRNYFYRVSLIKQSFGVDAVATGNTAEDLSASTQDPPEQSAESVAEQRNVEVPSEHDVSELDDIADNEPEFEDDEHQEHDADFELSELDGPGQSEPAAPASNDEEKLSSEEDAILVEDAAQIESEMQGKLDGIWLHDQPEGTCLVAVQVKVRSGRLIFRRNLMNWR
eukprot:TRINITY_DN8491_c0_g1_i1.p1 TRINITY_DN8491_c0_g1~~TRINITY_DN8491_c0_g1_i1.p1  ORF type:complete len:317 (+),score=73.70 TRINITY_DN8491_c0_g1_i1:89-1039(+)